MIILWILVGFALLSIVLVWRKTRTRYSLSPAARHRIESHWKKVLETDNPAQRVMQADIVLDLTLKELGYEGTVGEKLKAAGAVLPNIDAIWKAHKLRNRIAHEPNVQVGDRDADNALKAFEKAIRKFL